MARVTTGRLAAHYRRSAARLVCEDCGAEMVSQSSQTSLCPECEDRAADWDASQERIDRAAAAGRPLRSLWD